MPSVADAVASRLRGLGVARAYGHPLGDLDHVGVADADVALLLADADGRVGGGWGAAVLDGQLVHLSSQPGGTAHPVTVGDLAGFDELLASLALRYEPATVAVQLDLDLDAPAPDVAVVEPAAPPVVVTLSPSMADLSMLAVVGPGATRADAAAVERMAVRGGIGVVNTWGAKGVLRWDSPFHYGTVGLQARDLDLLELDEVDVVLAVGLDPDELGADAFAARPCQEVSPWQLDALLADWPAVRRDVAERPPFYGTVSAIVTPMYERSDAPLAPPRAALHLSGAAPTDGVVVADAGMAGFWLARTFPTGVPGSVVVPALDQPGFAVAAAIACGLAERPCIAVIDGPTDPSSEMMLEVAAQLGLPIAVQSWVEGAMTPDDHVEACRRGFAGGGPHLDVVGVDGSCVEPLLAELGEITAWS